MSNVRPRNSIADSPDLLPCSPSAPCFIDQRHTHCQVRTDLKNFGRCELALWAALAAPILVVHVRDIPDLTGELQVIMIHAAWVVTRVADHSSGRNRLLMVALPCNAMCPVGFAATVSSDRQLRVAMAQTLEPVPATSVGVNQVSIFPRFQVLRHEQIINPPNPLAKGKIQKVNILADDMGPLRGPLRRDCESAITDL